jgi:hypothetical protein
MLERRDCAHATKGGYKWHVEWRVRQNELFSPHEICEDSSHPYSIIRFIYKKLVIGE